MTTTDPTAHRWGDSQRTSDAPASTASRSFGAMFDSICANIAGAVHGKDDVIRLTVTCLIAGGHLLIEDVPGVGKTTIAKALARSVDGSFGRVQFTPDLLPSDVLGSSVWNQGDGSFEFRAGPVFHHLVLSDEINRASPKTQSALLEAMAEEQVTVDGTTYPLPRPFMVVATQNPIEHQGTFPLPESQLDRFLMRLSVGYPGRAAEIALLVEPDHGHQLNRLRPVVTTDDVLAMRAAASSVHVSNAVAGYLVDLAERSRRSPAFSLGMSPRASLGLLGASQVHAAGSGRDYVTPDDVKDLAVPVLAHRVVLAPESQLRGVAAADAVAELLATTPVPS
ncbi:MAG TPA: MoxR family ATPase [Microthrixaceae bacterium]|nr:MoxR family ATPase [Microthrixaceae bacterium]